MDEESRDVTRAASTYEELLQRVNVATDRINKTVDEIDRIGNRVFGSLPEGAHGVEEKQREPTGEFEHVLAALDRLDAGLARLERVTARITRV